MTTYSLHYESPKLDPLKAPYPHHLDEKGNVGRQDFWHGDPLRVIDFSRIKRAGTVTIYGFNPKHTEELVGLYPVFVDSGNGFSTGRDKIARVTVS